ncbi:hypothetical protein GGR57DRAFT_140239 [Xylariaceae sp. FL1272]|nr:hypothetical protein GGR57DRAFT_140239 [Xylariaceae sp. FL1272]
MADDAGLQANVLPVLEAEPLPDDVRAHVERWSPYYRLMFPSSAPATVREYQPEFIDLSAKRPSLLNFAGTGLCGLFLGLVLLLHFEIYSGWLTKHGCLTYILQVSGKALICLLIAIQNTMYLDILGTTVESRGKRLIAVTNDRIYIFFFRRFGWFQILDNAQLLRDADGQLVVNDARTGLRELLLRFLADAAIALVSYAIACATTLPLLEIHGMTVAQQMPLWFADHWTLQAVDSARITDNKWHSSAPVYHHVVPYCLQFMQSVFLWLLGILFMAKADRFMLRGHLVRDPKYELLWCLTQATNIHLIWLTGYQIACDIILCAEAQLIVPSWRSVLLHCPIPWRLLFPEGSLIAGLLVLVVNYLLWTLSLQCARLLLPPWTHIIKWQTSFSQLGIDGWRILWHEYLVQQRFCGDVGIRPNHTSFLWPFLFGLKSLWPSGVLR